MNIHEYQAKALLRSYGAPVSDGRAVLRAEEAKTAAGALDGPLWVVKAQIHAGGRGKGSFKEPDAGDKGGVRLAKAANQVTVLDIFMAIEGERPLFQTQLSFNITGSKPTLAQAAITTLLTDAEISMKNDLQQTTIADLMTAINK